eukprot:8930114-Karenia_brevis.AAC.1
MAPETPREPQRAPECPRWPQMASESFRKNRKALERSEQRVSHMQAKRDARATREPASDTTHERRASER